MRTEHKTHLSHSSIHHHQLLLVLQPLDALIQLLDLHNKMSNRVKQPVENECNTDQQGIPLALHD